MNDARQRGKKERGHKQARKEEEILYPEATTALVVDVQDAFLNEIPENQRVAYVRRAGRLLGARGFEEIFLTTFINKKGSLFRKALSYEGATFEDEETPEPSGMLIEAFLEAEAHLSGPQAPMPDVHTVLKSTYAAQCISRLFSAREAQGPVVLLGIDTDGCVLATAINLFDAGIRPLVVKDCCFSTGGKHAHEAGIRVLERQIGKEAVLSAEELLPKQLRGAAFDFRSEPNGKNRVRLGRQKKG